MSYIPTGRPVGRPKTKRARICPSCKRAFMPTNGEKHCSRPCFHISMLDFGRAKPCERCGNPFVGKPIVRFCSHNCSNSATYNPFHKSGAEHWNWQGGKNNGAEAQRKSYQYEKWQKAVFERDNKTCQECGASSCEVHAHHIFEFADYPERRFDVANGITLCRSCHEFIHGNAKVA